MGGIDYQLADFYNILNKLENISVSYWTCMILTMLYRKCRLAYIGKNQSPHQDQINDNNQFPPNQPEWLGMA